MDLIADYAGDDHLVILPELDRAAGAGALASIVSAAQQAGATARTGAAVAPDDGTSADTVIATLRARLHGQKPPAAPPSDAVSRPPA